MQNFYTWVTAIFITALIFGTIAALPFIIIICIIAGVGFLVFAAIHDSKLKETDNEKRSEEDDKPS